ncbi:hypothetical protein [Paenibacillus sp. EZ-K15]|uniref:hypothetical protein n=1 Tax=Paenibacillus sp. EZ-K15 TaxID=2044275 RepID=UPI0012902692|nr:hypothetical protein [Paenibacillus sp. EZ-K15]
MRQTSHNTIRSGAFAPWSAKSEGISLRSEFRVQGSVGGQPCEPNRAAAGPSGLKVLGFGNTTTLCAITGKY